jgi:serine/threonine protein kinase
VNTKLIEENGFRLVEQVDDTSRTVVWKAVQNTLDRTVIIRVLKPEAAAKPLERDHFLSIARLFARIKSESISAVFDIVSEGDLHYVVMEFVDGPTLEELVATQGPLPCDQTLRIAASLIASLDQMWHSAHIVHRNLKSSTIRLDSRGVAKITDFSMAIAAGPSVDATALDGGHIVGTPCYLSPEQAQGSHMLNTQSDMYALGVVLYHLATGRVPFEDLDVVSILSGHIKHQIPPPHRLNKQLPVVFSWFLHRLMMKNPNNRYADWDEVLHDIRLILSDSEPSCVRPDEEYLSTIDTDFEAAHAADSAVHDTSRLRLNRKGKKSEKISAYQGKHLTDGHAIEIRRDELIRAVVCWGILACWLTLIFWFRAVYQADPAHTGTSQTLTQLADATMSHLSESLEDVRLGSAKEEDPDLLSESPVPDPDTDTEAPAPIPAPQAPAHAPEQVPAPAPAPAPNPQPAVTSTLPAGIPDPLLQRLAQAFAAGDLTAARECVKTAPDLFQEKDAMQALLDGTPEPDALVAEYLKAQIGRPLIFEHLGKQRTVIPRSVADGIVQLEANGRGVEIALGKLSADEKLRWMDKPKDAAQGAAYCMTLMRSSRRAEIHARATGCPLLSAALIRAAELVPPATPPAE